MTQAGLNERYPDATLGLRIIDTPLPPVYPVSGKIARRIESQAFSAGDAQALKEQLSGSYTATNLKTAEAVHTVSVLTGMVAVGKLTWGLFTDFPGWVQGLYTGIIGYYGGLAAGSKLIEPFVRKPIDYFMKRKQQMEINRFLDSEFGPVWPQEQNFSL